MPRMMCAQSASLRSREAKESIMIGRSLALSSDASRAVSIDRYREPVARVESLGERMAGERHGWDLEQSTRQMCSNPCKRVASL